MDLNMRVAEYIKQPEEEKMHSLIDVKELVSVLDLTLLNPDGTEEAVRQLCQKASSALGTVATICVYPKFVSLVATLVGSSEIKITSVANFPTGKENLNDALEDIEYATNSGAHEIDIVFPYAAYKQGATKEAFHYIQECKKACGKSRLKVILEISEFESLEKIYSLSTEVITAGADFIKTSTGKSKHGATVEGASVMLLAIKSSKRNDIGFKASGGIKHVEQAFAYINLAKRIMGDNWIKPKNFRIGASILMDNILAQY